MALYFLLAVLSGWVIFLSWIVFSTRSHYFKLVSRTHKGQIDDILNSLVEKDTIYEKHADEVKKEIQKMQESMQTHIQKIGLVRFSPFEKKGGQDSFVFSLLNNDNTGVIMNFIYTPDGLRVYSKKVESGKGVEFELTEEEKKAIT